MAMKKDPIFATNFDGGTSGSYLPNWQDTIVKEKEQPKETSPATNNTTNINHSETRVPENDSFSEYVPKYNFSNDEFTYTPYEESELVKAAHAALQNQLNNAPGAYKSKWQEQMNEIMNAYRDREDFQYDLDSDALYQQYADQYARGGKLAMMDTMGQAAAMTGGYGNSYATTAGNQAYQVYLQQLNDVVPELYGMAYDRHLQEGQDMLTEYSLLSDREAGDYAKYQDELSKYYAELDYLANQYKTEREYDYAKYSDGRDSAYQEFANQRAFEQWLQEFDFQTHQYNNDIKQRSISSTNTEPFVIDDYTVKDTDEIPDEYKQKASEFENNDALANWAYGLADTGAITEEQADRLIANNMDHNEKYDNQKDGSQTISYSQMVTSTNGWKVVDDGGTNWLWGVDNNAIVEAPNGEKIRLDNLVDKLVSEGMKKSDAKSYVKKLQKNLGV